MKKIWAICGANDVVYLTRQFPKKENFTLKKLSDNAYRECFPKTLFPLLKYGDNPIELNYKED